MCLHVSRVEDDLQLVVFATVLEVPLAHLSQRSILIKLECEGTKARVKKCNTLFVIMQSCLNQPASLLSGDVQRLILPKSQLEVFLYY